MDNDSGMADATWKWERFARRARVPLGFVFAGLFLWRARPSLVSLVLSLPLVVPGLLLRGYASGYVRKNAELTQTGPYAYTRNPLYLGSLLAALGFVAASLRWELALLFLVMFAAIYLPVILSEERFLRARFADFDSYAARVPRLLPRFPGRARDSAHVTDAFSLALYRQHREYNSLIGALALYATLLLLVVVRRHLSFL